MEDHKQAGEPIDPVIMQAEPYPDRETYAVFHPFVKLWWQSTFKEFAPPQRFSIVNIHRRMNTLISSPTGSGKTLSAFAAILSELVGLAENDLLENRVYCIYISPLKALSNDIKKNLEEPLSEIRKIAEKNGKELKINVGIRTGDTTSSEKAKMLKKAPHILITTPESFAIMLTTAKFRESLTKIEWVVIDEIHSLADSKRGVHMSLSLERLQELTNFCRIGLSATVAPLEEVAGFLVGYADANEGRLRPCNIVDVQYLKKLDLKVLSPLPNLIDASFADINDATYALLDRLIQEHKTTLIFTNTRSATERVVHHLKDRYPRNYSKMVVEGEIEDGGREDREKEDRVRENRVREEEGIGGEKSKKESAPASTIGAHHGSLSKEHRLALEDRLKRGLLKAVVCSTSLELGIDIGYIDLVILLGSPKSVARALQRIGRSGHKLHDEAKGRIIVLDRDDLVECSVLLKAALEKKIDKINIPRNCLDVLAQQIYGIAIDNPRMLEDVYSLIRRSYNFHNLPRTDFIEIIRYLSGQYVSLADRNVYAKIWYDEQTQMIGKRGKMARMLYMTNIGTIPDQTSITVKILGAKGNAALYSAVPKGKEKESYIGKIDEGFLERLKRGDVFVLGGNTYEFQYAQGLTVFVKTSVNRPPTVPNWVSEMLPLSFDLSLEIQKFRRYMEEHLESSASKEDVLRFIHGYLYVDAMGAESIYHYFNEQFRYALIPHDKRILVEHYDAEDEKHLIVHSLFGRRVNDVLSRAFGVLISRSIGKDVGITINDNGFSIWTSTQEKMPVMRALEALKSTELRALSEEAIEKTEVLGRRFRHCATRALMILRSYMGRRKSVGRQQMNSRLLIAAVKRIDPNFPILKEARREVLEDLMDIDHAVQVVKWLESERIKLDEIYTTVPTPFAFNLVISGYTDILKMEDRMDFLRRMHQNVLAKIGLKEGKAAKAREKSVEEIEGTERINETDEMKSEGTETTENKEQNT